MKNLNDLNTELCNLFLEVKNDKIEVEKVKTLLQVSDVIINNAKTQLAGVAIAEKLGYSPAVLGSLQLGESNEKGVYEEKSKFAKSLGYKNLPEAIADLGKYEFEQQFKNK